jgi:subtilisin family serine protease
MAIGVDVRDRWVLTGSAGQRFRLPVAGIRFASEGFSLKQANGPSARRIGLDRWVRIQLDPKADPRSALEALRQLPFVESAELDVRGSLAAPPDDPYFPQQWNMLNQGQPVGGATGVSGADIRAVEAWEMSTGADPVIVATLDSGTYPHSEFSSRLLSGRNMATGTSDTSDVCGGHGTRVAGIIAAAGDNGVGVAGINWTARILPIVVSDPCSVSQTTTAEAVIWAVDNGAQVINLSLQFSSGTELLHDAIKYAADQDVVLVAAAGNSSSSIAYPGRWPETIAVGAITNTDQRWSNSGVGEQLDLVAPGADVISTAMFNTYSSASGTSFAAPHVAGAAALMRSLKPELTRDQIREILLSSARDLSLVGYDTATGWGCLDLYAALLMTTPPEPSADINGDGAVDQYDLQILLASWGACPGCPADLDLNLKVDARDLTILLGHW